MKEKKIITRLYICTIQKCVQIVLLILHEYILIFTSRTVQKVTRELGMLYLTYKFLKPGMMKYYNSEKKEEEEVNSPLE